MDPNGTVFEGSYEAASSILAYFDCFDGFDYSYESLVRYLHSVIENVALLAIIYLVVCILIYKYVRDKRRPDETFSNVKRVLLVIAHPDDECMFFGPTLLHLIGQSVDVHFLCLSIGDYEGKGKVRIGELYEACSALGIKKGNITICIDDSMPDDAGVHWPSDHVANIILHHVEALSIDALITFDKGGVSGHPNHTSVFYGIARLCIEKRFPNRCTIFTLDSVNILRKYWGYLDLPLSFLLSSHRFVLCASDKKTIKNAMKMHHSQMFWFRHLYLCFSRYISINTLRRVTLSDLELDLELDD